VSVEEEAISMEDQVIALARLTPLEYDLQRQEIAKQMSVQVKTLDSEVARVRGEVAENESDNVVEEISPWESPVDGMQLLNEMSLSIGKYMILPRGAITVISLWCIGTYCMNAWGLWPKLLITSPEKRCGKSVLLEVIEGFVFRGLLTSNISPSAIFRCIEEWSPTLLLDEAETFTRDNDELNGIVNAGHKKRHAVVIRSEKVGKTFIPRKFSVWCPQVIAGIGEQRGTLHDRSIHIEPRRKLPEEISSKLPIDHFEKSVVIRRKCLRWAEDNVSKLQISQMSVPGCGNDRAQDNWMPLFAIADLVGGDWPAKVRGAYTIFTEAVAAGSEDASHLLIEDITEILEDYSDSAIFSRVLVEKLIELEDRPWFEWKRGKPLTQNSLSKLLRRYKVFSASKRIGIDTAKGYDVDQLKEAFLPYLSTFPTQSVTTSQPIQDKEKNVTVGESVTFQSVTNNQSVTEKPMQDKARDVVTDESRGIGHSEDIPRKEVSI